MVRRLLIVAAVLALTATTVVSTGAASLSDPFTGVWIGREEPPPNGDGSTDFMVIGSPGRGGNRTWLYYETWATFCGGGPLSASGVGRSEGAVLTVTVTRFRCSNGSPGAFPAPFELTMEAMADGHIDWGGVVFTRVW